MIAGGSMKPSIRKQRGVTLTGLIFFGGLLFLVAVLGIKVAPDYAEYYTTLANVKATAQDPTLQGAGVAQIKGAYLKRLQVSGGGTVKPEDLDIIKDGSEIVISFAYSKKVPLFHNVSLFIDFEGTSAAASSK
jgi:hypothetical protein